MKMMKKEKKLTLKKHLLYPFYLAIAGFIAWSILSSFWTLNTTGSGIIIEKINRGGHIKNSEGKTLPSGLFAKLDNNIEILIPPSKLWDIIKKGDNLQKNKLSFTYTINKNTEYNSFFLIIKESFRIAVFIWICFSIFSILILILNRKNITS